MIRRGSRSIALAVCLAFSFCAEARAQPTDADRALATELFDLGRELMAERRFDEACDKLEESQRLDPGGGTLLNLALCHEAQGRTATAWTELAEALAVAERDGHRSRIALASEHIRALRPRLSRLAVIVPASAAVDGLVVERDGTPLARAAWAVPTPVDPGTHRVSAHAPGRTPWSIDVDVGADAARRDVVVPVLEVTPPSRTATPTVRRASREAPSPPAASPASPWRTVGWATGGLGVVLVGVGAYSGLVTLDKDGASDAACRKGCTDRGLELNDEAKTAADVSTVALAAGAAALAVGVWLIVTNPATTPRAAVARPRRELLVARW